MAVTAGSTGDRFWATHRAAVLTGAIVAFAITFPAIGVARALTSTSGDESALWVVPVVGLLIGHVAGGAVAGRRAPHRPIVVAAAAGALAFAVSLAATSTLSALTGGRRSGGEGIGLTFVVTAFVYLQIALSMSAIGGLLGARSVRRREAPA